MNKAAFWSIAAIAVVVLLAYKYAALNIFGPNDEQKIRASLDQMIVATKEGRPGGVFDFLGSQFKINSEQPTGGQIANFIKDSHPDVKVPETKPFITGDTARVTASVSVKGSYLGFSLDRSFNNVSFVFQREDAHDWLVVPYKKWRLTQIVVPVDSLPMGYGS